MTPTNDQDGLGLPEIQVNARQLRDVVKDAWDALLASNEPPVQFRKGPGLVRRVVIDAGIYLFPVRRAALYGLLIRSADWVKVTPKGPVAGRPPPAVVADMLGFPDPRVPIAENLASSRM